MPTAKPSDAARAGFDAWRADVRRDVFTGDEHLQSLLSHYGRTDAIDRLRSFGQECVTIDALAHENNRDEHLPRLRRWDDDGRRVEAIDFHHTHREIGRRVYASGVMSLYRTPGHELEALALAYLLGMNGEAGHGCPLACTAGLIKILQRSDAPEREAWLERLYDPNYDTHFHGAQFLTEVQGGSDVGANTLRAEPLTSSADEGPSAADDMGAGWVRLHGEKWFCSVVDAQLMLLTARPADAPPGTAGLRAYAVPRVLPGGETNGIHIRRLKFKLGTKTMASGEIDFRGALAREVGDFKDTVSLVLNTSRLYNAMIGAGMMQRAYREALAYAHHRKAFGAAIIDFPNVARIIARLRAEAYGARSVSFALADLLDRDARGEATRTELDAFRMLVNLNKFWVSVQCTSMIRDAIEVLGGNGAIEEFSVLPRLLRDSIVCEQWEGPHNVLCAQVLRDCRRMALHEPMLRWLEEHAGDDEASRADLVWVGDAWRRLLTMEERTGDAFVRDVAEATRLRVQAMLLRAEGRRAGAPDVIRLAADHLIAQRVEPMADPAHLDRVQQLVERR